VEPVIDGGARDLVDIGVGTGNLALAALQRWPEVRVHGIDASGEMVRAVEAEARRRLGPDGDRFAASVALAAELPFEDASFDAAVSSFVLQLVPNRARALREIRRVLRPGGTLGYVTWLREVRSFAPDRIFDALLDEYGFEDGDGDDRSGDIPSVSTATAELRSAGFRAVTAEAALLEYEFSVESYIGFLVEFDEESLFAEMDRSERRRFLATLRARLLGLGPEEMVFRAQIVYALGRRSDA
jgi:SAM-dependent methyltransferase